MANANSAPKPSLRAQYGGLFQYTSRAFALVWATGKRLTLGLAALSALSGVLPGAIAWVGKHLIDAILLASNSGAIADRNAALEWVGIELGLVLVFTATSRALVVLYSLLRQQLGHRINMMILEKAATLELVQFEDSELYDKLTRARREASARPVSLVSQTFDLGQNVLAIASYAVLLFSFSPWAFAVLLLAALPPFFAEIKFSGDAFRLSRWRTPETREQSYLEMAVAREDHAKEVILFGLAPRFLRRYNDIFTTLYAADRALTIRRGMWGVALTVVGAAAFYSMYVWIALAAIAGTITIGAMTMYVAVFRQSQSTLGRALGDVSGMYEDNLYLSNLYEFLGTPTLQSPGTHTRGPNPADGVRFENVSFHYPGAAEPALTNISLHIPPGSKLAIVGENGSGKTTLIKLLTRMYEPTSGRVMLDGLDLKEWDRATLHRRVGVIFQDFVRYQQTVGENIGAGDDRAYDDRYRWEVAADKGLAQPFITEMPETFDTQLGRWFRDGRELSLGQWQKIALSRAFMRQDADIVVLDEPTASMDAEAEVKVFERFREITAQRVAIVISHRFSTVRMADHIIVLDHGTIREQGTHAELLAKGGRYATLFHMQAKGYL